MYRKWYAMAAALCLVLMVFFPGCAKKNVRHLASDVCLVSPEKTTKAEVLTYLGQPNEQYEMADGSETWIYYDENKSILRDTPYFGDKLGDKKYEMVTVTFGGDIVKTCVYRSLSEEEFEEGRVSK